MKLSINDIMHHYFRINWTTFMLLHSYYDQEDIQQIFDQKKDSTECPAIWIERDSPLGQFLMTIEDSHMGLLSHKYITQEGLIRFICKETMKSLIDREKWELIPVLYEWCTLPKEKLILLNFNLFENSIRKEMETIIQRKAYLYQDGKLLPVADPSYYRSSIQLKRI